MVSVRLGQEYQGGQEVRTSTISHKPKGGEENG